MVSQKFQCLVLAMGLGCSLLDVAVLADTKDAPRVDFNRDVRPILSEHCFACHGFDDQKREANLRLDRAEAATASRDGGAAIVPGKPEESEVWRRICSTDADEVMPPPRINRPLSDQQKQVLRIWIEQGAAYSAHWSLEPPVQRDLPRVAGQEIWHPIDAWVRHRLQAEGLSPSAQAEPQVLIRRLALDLTGLPPTPEEVQTFVADPSPQAFERQVDQYLRSPHFGERLAVDWLDAARYADTNGYSIDGGRHQWLWRDWVIQAFNDNKPYDRFLVEQLAGDLLPKATVADKIATGFQRNNMVTHEGGTIPEENLANYTADRVRTLGEAVLGITLGCAGCHNHKFDPFTQRDYYQLAAYFNSLGDRGLDGNGGVNPSPSIEAITVLQTGELPELRAQIERARQALSHADPVRFARWVERERQQLATRGRNLRKWPLRIHTVSTPNRGAGFEIEGGPGDNRVSLRQAGDLGAFDMAAELPATTEPITALRATFHPVADLPGGGWGSGPTEGRRGKGKGKGKAPEKGTFVLTAVAVTADQVPGDQVNLHKLRPIDRVTASSWDSEFRPGDCLDPRNHNGWSPDPEASGPVHVTFSFAEPLSAQATPHVTVQLNFGFGKGMVPGLLELEAVAGNDDGTDLPGEVVTALEKPGAEIPEADREKLEKYALQYAPEWQAERIALANLEERLEVLTKPHATMVMEVSAQPRKTFILRRGDYSQPVDEVTVGTPAALPPLPPDVPANRLGLAQWLTMPGHPLTARVAVNRFWRLYFGQGLVGTPADFGSQGEWPSHPELLDWLAVDFQQHGWDVKRLVKQMVTSATYQQSSHLSPAARDKDPANRLLARGPRYRLPAEAIRDQALSVSGLLVPWIGGPSVNPYTPGDLWREISHYGSTPATAQTFVQDHGVKLYRRSLYTFWKRTAPPPNLAAFDAPNREVCTVARPVTTTPLQALVTLNDPQFVEAARAFAQRILQRSGSDESRLEWAFLAAVARSPSPSERQIMLTALARERQRYAQDPAAAAASLSVGESPRDEKLSAAEHAAWTQVASLLFNLHEFLTRG